GLDELGDHGMICVAEFALVVDHAAPFEAGGLLGEEALLVHSEGDFGINATCFQRRAVFFPDLEVLSAVARRGMHEAGTGALGDMLPGKERHVEFIASAS